jgi:tripartite-type tricarboxylate transporter receptor subunit TctC
MFKKLLYALTATVALVAVTPARADTWPSRPVKLVVPTGAGAATDVIARLIADGLSRKLDKPVVVENQPGASGILAHQAVARATPDGHTLLFTNTSGMAINLVSFRKLSYDPRKDFMPIALVASLAPQMLSVNADLPVKNVSEFIAYAKSNRGKIPMAFDATAGAGAFAAKLLNKRAGLELIEVPYKAAAQMIQDTAGGTTSAMMSSIAAAEAVVQAGKVRRLAITSDKRFPSLPDVPPLNDVVPGVIMNGWFAVVAPAGIDRQIVDKLNKEIAEYLKESEIQKRMISFGIATEGAGTPENTANYIAKDQNAWEAFAKELNIERQ